jgi:hypothetical protein
MDSAQWARPRRAPVRSSPTAGRSAIFAASPERNPNEFRSPERGHHNRSNSFAGSSPSPIRLQSASSSAALLDRAYHSPNKMKRTKSASAIRSPSANGSSPKKKSPSKQRKRSHSPSKQQHQLQSPTQSPVFQQPQWQSSTSNISSPPPSQQQQLRSPPSGMRSPSAGPSRSPPSVAPTSPIRGPMHMRSPSNNGINGSPLRSPSAYMWSHGKDQQDWLGLAALDAEKGFGSPVSSPPQGRYSHSHSPSWTALQLTAAAVNYSPQFGSMNNPYSPYYNREKEQARISKIAPLAPYLPSREGLAAIEASKRRALLAQKKLMRPEGGPLLDPLLLPQSTDAPNAAQQALQAQQLLAHLCMSVASAPSNYLETMVRRVADLCNGIVALGFGAVAAWSTPALASLGIDPNDKIAVTKHHRAQSAAMKAKNRRGSVIQQLNAPDTTLIDLTSNPGQGDQLNIQALAQLLTPAQSAQLHLFPQLLIQAMNAALAAHAAANALVQSHPPLLGFSTQRTSGGTRIRTHRIRKKREWDDYFGSKLVLFLQHGSGKPKERGTFGVPPPLLPSVLAVEKTKQLEAKQAAARAIAKQRERDRAFLSLERAAAPLPAPEFHIAPKAQPTVREREVALVRKHLERLAPSSPVHQARLAAERRARDMFVSGYTDPDVKKTGLHIDVEDAHTLIPAQAEGIDADGRRIVEEEPLPPPDLPALDDQFLDDHLYANQDAARTHLLLLNAYTQSALMALTPDDQAANTAPWLGFIPPPAAGMPGYDPMRHRTEPRAEWDPIQHVNQALAPFLSYFEGSRVQFALPPPTKRIVADQAVFQPAHRNGPLRMYTSGASGTMRIGVSAGVVAADMRLEANLWPEEEVDLLIQGQIARNGWFLPGFKGAQRHPPTAAGETDATKRRLADPEARLDLKELGPNPARIAVTIANGFHLHATNTKSNVPAAASPDASVGSESSSVDATIAPPPAVAALLSSDKNESNPLSREEMFATLIKMNPPPPPKPIPPPPPVPTDQSAVIIDPVTGLPIPSDPNAPNTTGTTAVGTAPTALSPPSANATPRLLLPAKSVVATSAQISALFQAAVEGALDDVAAMLSAGVNVNVVVSEEDVRSFAQTAATGAAAGPSSISSAKAPSVQLGDQIIHVACRLGDKRLLRLCLKAGADMHCINNAGDTPMHSATTGGFIDLAKYLQSKGADHTLMNKAGQMAAPTL